MKAITLFSSAGIGDLAIKKHSIDILVANELIEARVALHRRNFPDTAMIAGDIWQCMGQIIQTTLEKLNNEPLDFVFATPPCQGMSKNGLGKLLNGIRNGTKSKFDERNQLIIPTIKIIKELRPKIVFLENVPEMLNTMILDDDKPIRIIDYIERELGKDYVGTAEVVQFADLGIPQRRSRLITIYTRDESLKKFFRKKGSFIPERTHSQKETYGKRPWLTVRDVIGNLPKLDAKDSNSARSSLPFHYVPVLDPKKYGWIQHTPPEKGAFDNQCVSKKCRFQNNPAHGSSRTKDGINRAKTDTPLYCVKCGSLLPRPYSIDRDGSKRIMKGYTSAYKRMSWDLPSPTLTTNLSYPSSDHKIHPEQNRVLSLLEAFKLHTLDQFHYEWEFDDLRKVPDTVVKEVIGESIPPLAIYRILDHLLKVMKDGEPEPLRNQQLELIGYSGQRN